jgi:uncharacterized protein (TIGR03083 family)
VGVGAQPDLAGLYRAARGRVISLVSGLDDATLATRVAACPAWSVHDVVAHLTAITEDALAGRLTVPPGEAETAAQVARFTGLSLAEIIAIWDANAPMFEQAVGDMRVWPAVIDIASHEQDVRGALGKPGARDTEAIWHCAQRLLGGLKPPVPVRIVVEDAEFLAGPDGAGPDGTVLTLRTNRFEAFRWRMGRRSRAQLAALDWSGDPSPVLDHLTVFGPSVEDIFE